MSQLVTQGTTMLAELEQQGVVTRRALYLPDEVSEAEIVALGVMIADERDKGRFLLGDLLVIATARYGSDFTTEVMEATGLSFYTLRNMESVMYNVRPEERRPELSFSHHAAVAKLEPSEQRRMLGLAVEHRWTRDRLRDEVDGEKPVLPAVHRDLPDVVREAMQGAREMMDGWLISRDSYVRILAALGEQ